MTYLYKKIKSTFDSFDTIKGIKIYYGTLENNSNSLEMIDSIKNSGYDKNEAGKNYKKIY